MDNKSRIQVVGVGLPRTGTASLQRALQELGYTPCHHMQTDVIADPFPYRKGRRWLAAWRTTDTAARRAAIRAIFEDGGFNATVDFPPSMFVDDLMEMYPDAKFVLSVRKSPEAWRKSFDDTLGHMMKPWWYWAAYLVPSQRFMFEPMNIEWQKTSDAKYGGARIYQTKSTDFYTRHNEYVRKVVPEERLLVHESSQGWGPLCRFLGKEVPNTAYPHLNDTNEIKTFFMIGMGVGLAFWVGLAAVCAGTYWIVWT